MSTRPRLFLIDGTALAYRSYFAFIRNPLYNSKGQNTSAVYGYTTTLLRLLGEGSPERVAVVFDSAGPTFRHEKFPDYKATRQKMPDEMAEQLPLIDQVTEALGVHAIECPGYEADDIIGTIARKAGQAGWECYIVSGDKDFMQLVSDDTKLLDIRKGSEEIIGRQGVVERFGVPPEKVRDVLGLMGDSSDNVPGVEGVGEKTAVALVRQFGSLEAALENAERVSSKRAREGLLKGRERAALSKELVTIDVDAPVDFDPEDFERHEPDPQRLIALFEQLEFPSLIEKVQLEASAETTAYHTVRGPADFEALIERLREAGEFVLDLETTSPAPMEAQVVGLSFAVRERQALYVPAYPETPLVEAGGLFENAQSQVGLILERLRPILEDPKLRKGGQNIKYDMVVLANHGIRLRGVAFDTMVESYLLNPSQRQHNLDLLALKHLNIKKTPTSALIGKGKNQISMREVPVERVAAYACEDADVTLRLHRLFVPNLEEHDLDQLYHEVEVPLVSVLARMELRGVKVDLDLLSRLSADFAARIDALKVRVFELAGEDFNINSTQQLGRILFEKLKIHVGTGIRPRKTKTGYGTSVAALEAFATHPLVGLILEYRKLTKLKNTYVDAFPALVNPRTGRIHTSFNQTVTATGRLSSSEPNLQNIPIRTELGRKIRQAFIPSSPERRLLCADYSQVELRVLAHMSGDPTLIAAFRNDEDIHRRTASEVFEVPFAQVSAELRARAKAINFGIIYGMGAQRLARDTGISLAEANEFIERYFRRYPLVEQFIEETKAAAERDGFVTTLLGRRRHIPEIYSQDPRTRAAAERIAVNTPIQGSAADLIKLAMVRLDDRLGREFPDAWMILQVHDELVFDVPADQAEPVGRIVRQEMERAMDLDVPLKVDLSVGTNWAKA